MKRFLTGLLCICLVLLGTAAIAGLAKKAPFLIVVKTMSQADAATLAASTNLPVHYVNTADGLAYFVTAAGVHYNLTAIGSITGGSGNSYFATPTQSLETGNTVYLVPATGVSIWLSTSGVSPVIYEIGVNSILTTIAGAGNTAYGPGAAAQFGSVETTGGVSAIGGVTAPYFFGSGSKLTGIVATDFGLGVSTPGVSIYHTTAFDKTPLFITTDQDGIAGITVQATPHNAKIGIAIVNDAGTWRIVNDGADGATLKFYKGATNAFEMDDTGVIGAGSISATGNLIGATVYSYAVDSIGGIELYTKSIGGNHVYIKIPGHGALLTDYTLTLPVTTGASGQALLTNGAVGQLTWGNPTAVETDAIALAALNQSVSGTSVYFIQGSVSMPHQLTDSGATPFSILPILAAQFPSGVTVVEMGAEVTSGPTAYQLEFQIWSGKAQTGVLGRVNCPASGVSAFITGVTEVGKNNDIFVSPPTTAAHVVRFWMRYFRR